MKKILMKYFRYICVVIILFAVTSISSCTEKDSTPLNINLRNKDVVAGVVAELQKAKDEYSGKEDKIENAVNEILLKYGIDTYSEKAKFAKTVQKYSYQQDFTKILTEKLK